MQQEEFFPELWSGKTSPARSTATEDTTSEQSSQRWMTSGLWRNGGTCWMHNISESPSGVEECSSSLSLILLSPDEPGLDKYCLSPKAAEGIMRRADRRGRSLPPLLRTALERVAQTTTKPKPDIS